MNRFKIHGLLILTALISGCGNRAYYLRQGTVIVIEKDVEVIASVPDKDGNLVPGTRIKLPAGTEAKYGDLKK